MALTPALSSIFDDTTGTLTHTSNVLTAGISSDKQLTTNFAYLAYSRAWLAGHLPAFTTDEFALSPFVAVAVNETWQGTTTLFESELQCNQAVPMPLVVDGVGVVGVNLTAGETVVEYVVRDLYLGYEVPKRDIVDKALGDYFDRPESDPVSFIVGGWTSLGVNTGGNLVYIWGPRSDSTEMAIQLGFETSGRTNWTAVICKPGFWKQEVVATIDMASGEVVGEVQRKGSRTPLDTPQTSEFTTSVHIGQVGLVLPSTANLTDLAKVNVTFGRITAQFPNVDSQMKKRFGETFETPKDTESPLLLYHPNTSGLTAFALYSRVNGSLAGLLDPTALGGIHETAFKLMFANAVTVEMIDQGKTTAGVVERSFRATGWAVNSKWGRVTEVGFALLAGITMCLAVITWQRRTNLQHEPGNLAAAITLLSKSPDVGHKIENAEYYDPEVVDMMLRSSKRRYLLSLTPDQGPQVDVIDAQGEDSRPLLPPMDHVTPFISEPDWILTRMAGLGFLAFFSILFCLLIFIFTYDRTHRGKSTCLPSSKIPVLTPCRTSNSVPPIIVWLQCTLLVPSPTSRNRGRTPNHRPRCIPLHDGSLQAPSSAAPW